MGQMLTNSVSNTALNNIEVMERALKFSEIMAQADIIPAHYRGKTANVFIALQTAFRMNLDPMQVMQNTYVVSGKLGMVSSFAISLANQSGIFASGIRYRVEGSGDSLKVTAYAHLKSSGEEISYTIGMKEAIAENWTKNPKYRTLPELMLRYRAATLLIRTHVPEVLNGLHMVEELEDVVASTKNITPKAQTISSKLDSVLEHMEAEVEESPKSEVLTELMEQIRLHNIPQETVDKWCSKAGVNSLTELSEDKQLKCLQYIDEQYNYTQELEVA